MIGEFTLSMLCSKYNIDSSKLLSKNNYILTEGEYKKIDSVLDYLVNELNISSENIEKCPSVLYKNISNIKANVSFLKTCDIDFSNIESCLHVLCTDTNELMDTYEYVESNYGISFINKNTSILYVPVSIIKEVEGLGLKDRSSIISIAVAIGWGSTTVEDVKILLNSNEYKEHPELFTAQVLAHAKLSDIRSLLDSEAYKEHPELFTSQVLVRTNLFDIRKMLQSNAYKEHPELFTSETLGHASLDEINRLLASEEYEQHPELFTSETLARTSLIEIKRMLLSDEYKAHPELFTSQVLAHAKLEDIKELLASDEYKAHPELFTSQVLAHARLEDIKELLASDEYKTHPNLFTSQVLAHAKLEDIKTLLSLDIWKDERYSRLLTSSIVAKAKQMIIKIPVLLEMAKDYQIENYISTSFLLFAPSYNYALIKYLEETKQPLVVGNGLNYAFGKQPNVLLKKYDIDIKECMERYPLAAKYQDAVEGRGI